MNSSRHNSCRCAAPRRSIWLVTLFAVVSLSLTAHSSAAGQAGNTADATRIRWKSVEMAQVRLDDKAPLHWNVYQPDKKDKKDKKKDSDLVLVFLGHRYIMLDTKARLVYLVPLADLQAQGADFESGDLAQESRVVPSTEWTERDVGPAELINLTLGDYGRVLEVSLPHMPDLRPFY
jgi:hypothetical protein